MRISVMQDAAAVADEGARVFTASAIEAIGREGRFTVALSGGSTPRILHARLADANGPFRSRVAWQSCEFFWGDERHVPPDHADSNYRMARETLLDPLQIAASQIHRIRAELPDASAAAIDYEQTLRAFFAQVAFPPIHLQLLGMGPDGHTASLFPGTSAVHEPSRWVIAPWVEKFQTFRITLSPPAINAAARVVFLVTGADKADALREVIEGARDPDKVPAQIVAPSSGDVNWIVDRAAASKLSARPR
jgi:6-phosphogluconolactonase